MQPLGCQSRRDLRGSGNKAPVEPGEAGASGGRSASLATSLTCPCGRPPWQRPRLLSLLRSHPPSPPPGACPAPAQPRDPGHHHGPCLLVGRDIKSPVSPAVSPYQDCPCPEKTVAACAMCPAGCVLSGAAGDASFGVAPSQGRRHAWPASYPRVGCVGLVTRPGDRGHTAYPQGPGPTGAR